MVIIPMVTRAGMASAEIQNDNQERMTTSVLGMYSCTMLCTIFRWKMNCTSKQENQPGNKWAVHGVGYDHVLLFLANHYMYIWHMLPHIHQIFLQTMLPAPGITNRDQCPLSNVHYICDAYEDSNGWVGNIALVTIYAVKICFCWREYNY